MEKAKRGTSYKIQGVVETDFLKAHVCWTNVIATWGKGQNFFPHSSVSNERRPLITSKSSQTSVIRICGIPLNTEDVIFVRVSLKQKSVLLRTGLE